MCKYQYEFSSVQYKWTQGSTHVSSSSSNFILTQLLTSVKLVLKIAFQKSHVYLIIAILMIMKIRLIYKTKRINITVRFLIFFLKMDTLGADIMLYGIKFYIFAKAKEKELLFQNSVLNLGNKYYNSLLPFSLRS